MPLNPLYTFLRKTTDLPASLIPLFKRARIDGKQFCLLELTGDVRFSFSYEDNTYHLDSHHLTLFKMEDPSVPTRNEYHYTAFFIGNMAKKYRLHIYFNSRDTITKDPVFEELGDLASAFPTIPVSPALMDALYSEFIGLAQIHGLPKIRELRMVHQQQISALEKQYKTLEKEAAILIANEPSNYVAYIAKLDNVSDVLTQLSVLGRTSHYLKCLALIQQLKAHVQEASVVADSDSAVATLEAPLSEEEATSIDPAGAPAPMKWVKSSPSASVVMIDDKIQAYLESHATHPDPKKGMSAYIDSIICALGAIDELNIQLEERGRAASPASLILLQERHRTLIAAVETVYPRLLLSGELALLEKLPSFHYLISPQLLSTVLAMAKTNLLDFILRHSDLDPTQPVTVAKITYTSVLHYCYEHKSAEWIDLLIEHHISLLEPGSDGLPIANAILRDVSHPLWALLYSKPLIIDSIPFHKQLIAALMTAHRRPDISPALQQKISVDIEAHQQRIAAIKISSKSLLERKLLEATDGLAARHSQSLFIEKIKTNPEFSVLAEKLKALNREYLSRLKTKSEIANYTRASTDYIKTVDDAIAFIEPSMLTFERVLTQTCNYMRAVIQLLTKQIELYDLQHELSTRVHTRIGRSARKKMAKQSKLVEEVQALTKVLAIPDAFSDVKPRLPLTFAPDFPSRSARFFNGLPALPREGSTDSAEISDTVDAMMAGLSSAGISGSFDKIIAGLSGCIRHIDDLKRSMLGETDGSDDSSSPDDTSELYPEEPSKGPA
jgi:hypothetical protein